MWWGGSSSGFLAEAEGERGAKERFAAIQSKGCGIFGRDAGVPADTFQQQLNSAQIRGFYVDSRNADAPGHDYQVQR
jgi:hypothetical protein